ncbi:MAG TPA: PEGA domain-containing protein [Opitutaceae bacterium]|nr:PEGA domain-containing protein [Opitutaceae bacterium]
MSTPSEKGYFLELNEYFLLAARTSSLAGPPVIEDLREAPLDSKTAVGQTLNVVFPETKKATARAVCALRPRHRFFHLAGDSETRQHSTPTALRTFVSQSPEAGGAASELVALQTSSGVPLNGSGKVEGRWFFEGSPPDSLASMQAMVRGWKLVPFRLEAATLALLGAIHAEQQVNKASGPLLLWEIGETTSDLLLISAKGLMAATRLAFGFNLVAEAVQSELNLKSRESAAKVFFNEFYDFSELGAKITARISTTLLPAITEFVPSGTGASVTLLCSGLPSKQAWFNEHLARSLGMTPWQPDVVGWCGRAGLNFIGNTLQGSLSPVWLGLLGVMSAFHADQPAADSAWHPTWSCNGQSPAPADKPAIEAAAPKTSSSAVPAATGPAKPSTPAVAVPAEKVVAAAGSTPPPPPLSPTVSAAPVPAATSVTPAVPTKNAIPAKPAATASVPPAASTAAVAPPPPPVAPAPKAVAASTPQTASTKPAPSPSAASMPSLEKPTAGDKAAVLGTTPAEPVIAQTVATSPAPRGAISVPAASPAPPAPPTPPAPPAAPAVSAKAELKAEPVVSVSTPTTPAATKTRAPVAAAATDKPAKRDKSTDVHTSPPAPTPAPTAAAAKAEMPALTKATAKTLIGKAMAVAAEAASSTERPVLSSAGASQAPVAPVPESPTSESSVKAEPLPAAVPVKERGPAIAAREAAPKPDTAMSATVREAPPTPTAPRPLSPLEAKAAAKLARGPVRARPFLKTPAGIAVVGSAVMVLGAAVFFYHQFAEEKAAALRAQAAAEQRAAAEAAARLQAEQKAKAEADARRLAEEEAARKNAAAEAARQQAAEETRRREMETNRLLNGRGSLVLASEPAGATVEISNFAPHVTPVTIGDLRLGRYAVKLSLPGYDPANLDVEVKDNESTNPGLIHLVRQTGSLNLTTQPAGLQFEVRPGAARFFATAADVHQGTTPATLADLPTGEYTVIFSRAGWPNHTQNVVIESKGAAQASSVFVGGTVTITSTPPGVSVSCNGQALGVTPLTLTDVQPGATTYTLELNGFVPIEVSGQVEPEQAMHLEGALNPADRIARIADLDERPEPIKTVDPSINPYQEPTGARVTISLIIDRDGVPKDLKVEQASSTEVGRRCLEAVAQWRFKPGKIHGVPVKTRVSLPFNIAPP